MDYMQLMVYLTDKAEAEEADEKFQENLRKARKGR